MAFQYFHKLLLIISSLLLTVQTQKVKLDEVQLKTQPDPMDPNKTYSQKIQGYSQWNPRPKQFGVENQTVFNGRLMLYCECKLNEECNSNCCYKDEIHQTNAYRVCFSYNDCPLNLQNSLATAQQQSSQFPDWALALTVSLFFLLCILGGVWAYCLYMKRQKSHKKTTTEVELKIPQAIRINTTADIFLEKTEALKYKYDKTQMFDCNELEGVGNSQSDQKIKLDIEYNQPQDHQN